MKLKDIIRNGEYMQQDDWSLQQLMFGEDGQIKVVGWSGYSGNAKMYIVYCSVCALDSELFGEGYFKSNKYHLVSVGALPCGCSPAPRWSKEQYGVLCTRRLSEAGYTFNGFVGDWKGNKTKVSVNCKQHGDSVISSMTSLLYLGAGCVPCGRQVPTDAKLKADDVMIESFFASGAFHPETKFWRSDRKSSQGVKIYWYSFCPDCQQQGESTSSSLQVGSKPCGCSIKRQQEAYINFVKDGDMVVALKFGIARKAKRRVREQNSRSAYDVVNHSIYVFSDVKSCMDAERQCKSELDCPVVAKYDMIDGWTETTWVYNLEKIVEIYERNGGVKRV